jgi:hypothetical protein
MHDRFTIGGVLGTGFSVWLKNLLPFTFIAALIFSPAIIWGVYIVQHPIEHLETLKRWDLYFALMAILLNAAASAALTYGVVMQLNGTKASIGACIGKGFSRLIPVLFVVLLSTLCVLGGMILLIIPGIIFSLMLYVATPVAVIEKPGIVASLKRSRELTYGHKAEIFAIVLLIGLASGVISYLMMSMAGAKGGFGKPDPESLLKPSIMYVKLGAQIVSSSLGAVMTSVSYVLLRREKEGTSTDALAAVFE